MFCFFSFFFLIFYFILILKNVQLMIAFLGNVSEMVLFRCVVDLMSFSLRVNATAEFN